MTQLDELTEGFKAKLELLMNACDSLEEVGFWDIETYGELDGFCISELECIILSLIISDNKIADEEVKYFDENFGIKYTKEEIEEIYTNYQNEIEGDLQKRICEDIEMLQKTNVKVTQCFKELIIQICKIIAASDEVVTEDELHEIDDIEKAVCL